MASATIGALRVTLGLDSAAFEKGLDRTTGKMSRASKDFQSSGARIKAAGSTVNSALNAFGVAISFTAIAAATQRGLEYASSLGEISQQLGVASSELQEYRYAASQAGISQDEMDAGLSKLTKTLGQAADGAKGPSAAFKELGVDIRDSAGNIKSAGAVIPELAEALSKIPDVATRARLETELFGKAGQKLEPLLSGGAKGVNDLRDAAHKLGIVLSEEEIRKADETADKLASLKQVLEARIAKGVVENADAILTFVDSLTKLVAGAGDAIKWLKKLELGFNETKLEGDRYWNAIGLYDGDFAKEEARVRRMRGEVYNGAPPPRQLTRPFGRGGATKPAARAPNSDFLPALNPFTSKGPRRAAGLLGAGGLAVLAEIDFDAVIAKAAEMQREVPRLTAATLDDVSAQFRRLDGEMVKVAQAATGKTQLAFADLRQRVSSLMDQLFPEQADVRALEEKYALLDASLAAKLITPAAYAAARDRLRKELKRLEAEATPDALKLPDGVDVDSPFSDLIDVDGIRDRSREAIDAFAENFSKPAKQKTAETAEAFSRMAQDVSRSLSQLVGDIENGDWLDALASVIDIVAQVLGTVNSGNQTFQSNFGSGSTGSGGSSSGGQSTANKSKGFATGGSFKVGGATGIDRNLISFRATRGEIVDIKRPGARESGGGNTYHFQGNLLTPEFWEKINAGDDMAAQRGATGAVTAIGRQQSRRVA